MTAIIYRDWDRKRLDSELNLRARWPEHPRFFERWARDSQAVRARVSASIDLAYGGSTGERLDIFPVPGRADAPLVAFLHGGYWQSLDKSDFSYLAPPLNEAGIAYASLNYDLAPKATIPTMVAQTRSALAWLYRNASAHGIDRDRIFVAGHSAGGQLAVMAMDRRWPVEERLPDDLVKGGLSISGVYDLEPVRLSYHQAVVGLRPDQVAAYSPRRCVPPEAGPLVVAVGGDETEEFLLQQREFLEVWRATGLDAVEIALPGRGHFDAVDALAEPGGAVFEALRSLVFQRESSGIA